MSNLAEKIHYFYRNILHILLYFIFIFIVISRDASYAPYQWIVYSIFTIILLFALFYEYLSYLYQASLYFCNVEVALSKSKQQLQRLTKLDFAHAYRQRILLFSIILEHMLHNDQNVLNTIKDNPKIFQGTINQYQIGIVYQFFAHVFLNQRKQANELYSKIKEVEQLKKQKKRIEKIFQWNEIEGYYHLNNKDYQKALKSFKMVNSSFMNPREKVHYLQGLLFAESNLQHNTQFQQTKNEMMKFSKDYEVLL